MPISLSIADNEDGTGAVATIAGSGVTSTNALYRAHFLGIDGPLVWGLVDSRTGDGNITVSTGPMRAYWLWYVKNTAGSTISVSEIVLQALTDTTYTGVRTRIREGIAAKLALLDLDQIDSTRIYQLQDSKDLRWNTPGVIVMPDVTADSHVSGTNIRDDIGYPFTVLMVDSADFIGSNAPTDKWDLWREKVDRAFRNQRISGVNEVYTCDIEPGRMPAVAPGEDIDKLYLSARVALTIRAFAREPRGINV